MSTGWPNQVTKPVARSATKHFMIDRVFSEEWRKIGTAKY